MDSSSCDIYRLSSLLHSLSLSRARIWLSAGCWPTISFGLRGPSLQAFTPLGGWVYCRAPWGTPNKGNADGAVGVLKKMPGACELRLCAQIHLKKGLCAGTWPVCVGRAVNKYLQSQSQFQRSLSETLPRSVIFLIVKLRRGLSQLSFVHVPFFFQYISYHLFLWRVIIWTSAWPLQ